MASATAAQLGTSLLNNAGSELSSSPQSGATAGDSSGGSFGGTTFGNVNIGSGSSSSGFQISTGLIVGVVAIAALWLLLR